MPWSPRSGETSTPPLWPMQRLLFPRRSLSHSRETYLNTPLLLFFGCRQRNTRELIFPTGRPQWAREYFTLSLSAPSVRHWTAPWRSPIPPTCRSWSLMVPATLQHIGAHTRTTHTPHTSINLYAFWVLSPRRTFFNKERERERERDCLRSARANLVVNLRTGQATLLDERSPALAPKVVAIVILVFEIIHMCVWMSEQAITRRVCVCWSGLWSPLVRDALAVLVISCLFSQHLY